MTKSELKAQIKRQRKIIRHCEGLQRLRWSPSRIQLMLGAELSTLRRLEYRLASKDYEE